MTPVAFMHNVCQRGSANICNVSEDLGLALS